MRNKIAFYFGLFTVPAACFLVPMTIGVTIGLGTTVLMTGCAHSPKTAYKTLSATEATVDASLKAFADLRVHGKVDDATYAKVDSIYKQYQAAFATAVTAAKLDPSSITPQQVADLAAQLYSTINAIVK